MECASTIKKGTEINICHTSLSMFYPTSTQDSEERKAAVSHFVVVFFMRSHNKVVL